MHTAETRNAIAKEVHFTMLIANYCSFLLLPFVLPELLNSFSTILLVGSLFLERHLFGLLFRLISSLPLWANNNNNTTILGNLFESMENSTVFLKSFLSTFIKFEWIMLTCLLLCILSYIFFVFISSFIFGRF